MALTAKRQRFIEEYLVDLNATRAAERAGYTPNQRSLAVIGSRLCGELEIAEAIQIAREERAKRVRVSSDRIVAELLEIAHSNIMHFGEVSDEDGQLIVDLRRMTPEQAATISEVTVEEFVEGKGEDAKTVRRTKLKFWSKDGAIKQLREHAKMNGANQSAGVTIIITSDDDAL